jgi:hypothetical protein
VAEARNCTRSGIESSVEPTSKARCMAGVAFLLGHDFDPFTLACAR